MRLTVDELRALNARFETQTPEQILRFVKSTFGPRAALLSSMQRAGSVLAHMADAMDYALDVLFVDTGVLHDETLRTRDRLVASTRNLRVITLAPAHSFAEQTRADGVLYLTREGQERCCDLRKSAPLHTVRGRYDALISGLRRDEGGARAKVAIFALDAEMNALRVHPLANFTSAAIDRYVAKHDGVVLNPLHAMGFPTIGCHPCTTPVRADEPERAGRWRHLAGVEYCGINPTDRAGGAQDIDLDDRYAAALRTT